MSTISEIEDKLMGAVAALGFKKVLSDGRQKLPQAYAYPSAFVYFTSERDTGSLPRPVKELGFDIVVVAKNLSNEEKAASDAYELMDKVMEAVEGKAFALPDIEPFVCTERKMAGYEDGVISYALSFKTRQYLPVPS